MSDEEHHFESKADAGASKTYPQQAGTIRKNGYIVIKGRPCKVVEVSTSKTGKHGHAKCHFVGIDIFSGKKLEDIVPSSHNSDVPHVNRTDYQLIDISEDGFVSLLTENGNTKDDLRLPTDETLLTQIRHGDVVVFCHVAQFGAVAMNAWLRGAGATVVVSRRSPSRCRLAVAVAVAVAVLCSLIASVRKKDWVLRREVLF
ncbi:eukaryotic translation initiation factor 5A [Citrus sinensis]|uniref:Eukaryotic translation initiation factor 5A n=1 Tax=Citrus sinensis TaxID=2711 RepID=A0ACB8LX50_CITSI|nr:eukaryotic translation initiation factor 5A [Citrus sinensis]